MFVSLDPRRYSSKIALIKIPSFLLFCLRLSRSFITSPSPALPFVNSKFPSVRRLPAVRWSGLSPIVCSSLTGRESKACHQQPDEPVNQVTGQKHLACNFAAANPGHRRDSLSEEMASDERLIAPETCDWLPVLDRISKAWPRRWQFRRHEATVYDRLNEP